MTNWRNPYARLRGRWLKGNLHTHTAAKSPCASIPLEQVLRQYEAKGYDFLSISDHMGCTAVSIPTHLILIPGMEWNSREPLQDLREVTFREHLGIYALERSVIEQCVQHLTPGCTIRALKDEAALIILNHPNWLVPFHYSESDLMALYVGVTGVEIYNAVIESKAGHSDATMKWDRLLTEKGPILGFASDDAHLATDIGKAWLMVNVEQPGRESVFEGIKSGRFYCTTGVLIHDIGRKNDTVYCAAAGKDVTIEAVGENGQVLASSNEELQLRWPDSASSYIRFTLYGQGKQQAWSQPFFRAP